MPKWSTEEIRYQVAQYLTPDLLTSQQRKLLTEDSHELQGHCYVASEVAYHFLGCGIDPTDDLPNGWEPRLIAKKYFGGRTSHWFLLNKWSGEILDITAAQFNEPIPYDKAAYCCFLTKKPSKRAQILMGRIADRRI